MKFGDSNVTTVPASKPESTPCNLNKLLTRRPAPIKSVKESASWLTTNKRCSWRLDTPPVFRPLARFRDIPTSDVKGRLGAHASSIAIPVPTKRVNAKTVPSMPISSLRIVKRSA